MSKSRVSHPLLIWFITIALLSCRHTAQQRTELDFWAMGSEGENIAPIISRFESEHPRVKIRLQAIPWTAAHEKLLTAFAGRSTPDVCQLGNTWIPEFQALNALLPLDSLIDHSATIHDSNYFAGIWETNRIGAHVYGIPWYVDTRLLFYRTDVLRRVGYNHPPRTWDEWLDISRKIKSSGSPENYAVFFPTALFDWQVPVILILSNQGQLFRDDNSRGAFDDAQTAAALRFYISFFQQNLAPRNMTQVTNVFQGFSSEFFSMMITGPWNISEMRKRVPELTGKWSTAPIPAGEQGISLAGGASLVVFKNSKRPHQAWQFIEFLSRSDVQEEFFRLTRDLPAVKKAWQNEEIRQDAEIQAFYHQLENVAPTPKIAEWEQIAVLIQQHLESVIFEKETLASAIQKLNQSVDTILEKRRWLLAHDFLTP